MKHRKLRIFAARRPAEVAIPAETAEMLDDLRTRNNIEITLPAEPFEVNLNHGQYRTSIKGQPAVGEEANWFVPLFVEEFGLYPLHFVEKTRLTRVVVCGELFRSQKPNLVARLFPGRSRSGRPPLWFQHQPCYGVPNVKGGIIYLPIAWGAGDQEYAKKQIHHEFYHCVQWRQFGRAGDPGWAALNSPDFVYGPGSTAALYGTDRSFWVMPGEEWGNGFVNHYSMSEPNEDQAEIFAHLVTKPAQMDARVRVDDILRRKVERLKSTLKQFCRDMDEAFWERIENSRLPFDL